MVLSTHAFTEITTLLAIFSGLIALIGMFAAKRLEGWTKIFLVAGVLTSTTGLFFPSKTFGPADVIAAISLLTLAIAIAARYGHYLEGAWRWTYVISAVLALYINVSITIARAFGKLPLVQALSTTRAEPWFVIAQAVTAAVFIVLGWRAVIKFRPAPIKFRRI
jgi:hypothetical protein